jgi:hypothetical protein
MRKYKKGLQQGKFEVVKNANDKQTQARQSFYDKYVASLKDDSIKIDAEDDDGDAEGGGSRKRKRDAESEGGDDDHDEEGGGKYSSNKKSKMNPFAKDLQAAKEKAELLELKKSNHEAYQKKLKEDEKKRQQKHALLTKKTSKGQPLMKNKVNDLLAKLQSGKGVLQSNR